MADAADAVAAAAEALAAAVEGDLNEAGENGSALKKRALELLTEAADEADAAGDDLELGATTLDDVMVSPVLKKARVDDENDDDEPLASGEDGDVDLDDLADDDADALAPPDASTDDEEETTRGNGKTLDVVTLDDEEDDEDDEDDEEVKVDDDEDGEEDVDVDDDEDEEEEGQLLSPMQRRKIDQNKNEARQLLHQLDSSARSKLVLTALDKYGEDLFEGHEAARDAILVDACANDAMLGLVKEAIRVSEMFMRGTEDAPLEVDDDEDYGDEDDDEDEETDDDVKRVVHTEDDDDDEGDDTPGEINLLSDEETDDNSSGPATTQVNQDDEDDEDDDDDDDDDDTAGTGGELTVESATGDEDSLDELSS